MMNFNGKILIIGCGAVAQCSLSLLLKNLCIAPHNIILLDPVDVKSAIQEFIKQGVTFIQQAITSSNYSTLLNTYLKAGDICIDLANNVDTYDILQWCQYHKVCYLNTCLNRWKNSPKDSLFNLYTTIQKLSTNTNTTSTAVLAHGANPGLISSFTKQALLDAAQLRITQTEFSELEKALEHQAFNQLAHLLHIKTIHISEKDTQNIPVLKSKREFINTWSVPELIDECTAPLEFAWGTHESISFEESTISQGHIIFKTKAFRSRIQSWVPYEEFKGMIIPHDEAYSIADFLSFKKNNNFLYRPTVLFAYQPCPAARESLRELTQQESYPVQKHIIKQEILYGSEKMGCLLLSPSFAWWTGSILSIQESNDLLKGQNSTVMQVAAGVLSGLYFLLQNPQKGICFPEQLDHTYVLSIAQPYLGKFVSCQANWTPSQQCLFEDYLIRLND